MGTHWGKGIPACSCASKNDVGVVILVNAEKALKCRFVSKTARELETSITLASA
jgi:hypothetical protein